MPEPLIVIDVPRGLLFGSAARTRLPTWLCMIETVVVEVPNPNHPFGVKGVAEANIVPPMAAIANAIRNATGKRLTQLPMSPPKVLEALEGAHEAR